MTSPEARAAEVIDHVGDEPSNVIAAALSKEGLLAPEPRIIRTRYGLAALDLSTVLITDGPVNPWTVEEINNASDPGWFLPALVLATGDQVRAARQALEEA